MQTPSSFERVKNWFKNSVMIRLLTIGFLILLLLIPVSMVEDIIRERKYRQQEAIDEVSYKWGQEQTITGLVLTIPYKTFHKIYDKEDSKKYEVVETINYAHFLPEDLNISGTVNPEVRYRGNYEVVVYTAEVNLNGKFSSPDFKQLGINGNIQWEDAEISVGLSDLRSIQQDAILTWDKQEFSFNPGVVNKDVIQSGISTRVPLKKEDGNTEFSLSLKFNGSSGLHFTPLGKETNVKLNSNWPDPSFTGAFLPDQREIRQDGFSATWNVLHLNRPYPQQFKGHGSGIEQSNFGIDLIMPVDEYQKSTRAAKYAALFITLTFLIFFFIQVLNKIRIHPIQYLLVGLAICVFYILLISVSEHISFQFAYLIASIPTVSLITFYAKNIFESNKITLILAFVLIILYSFIFTIIQLQGHALLIGSIGLFIVLATIMYLSRNINWYSIASKQK